MRFSWRLKNFISVTLATLFCFAFGLAVRTANVTRLGDIKGERTYFLNSASSQALQKNSLTLGELGKVRGECVSVIFSENEGGMYALKDGGDALAQEIMAQYSASLLFTESVCGVTSYYAHTPHWSDGVMIKGVLVNLHIAVKEDGFVVGTPLIFGGY